MKNQRISTNKEVRAVRVWEGGKGAKQTYFFVKHYGSWDKAYRAALAYEKTLPVYCRLGRRKPRDRARCDSQSGVVGVSPVHNRDGDQIAWRAHWVDPETSKRKSRDYYFSIHGNSAFDKAKRKRLQMTDWANFK